MASIQHAGTVPPESDYSRWVMQFRNDLRAVPKSQKLQWAKAQFGKLPDPPRNDFEMLYFAGEDVMEYQREEWKQRERIYLMLFGAALVVFLAAVAVAIPNPSPSAFWIFRLLATLGAGAVGAFLPGSLNVTVKRPSFVVRAAGALGFAVVVYLINPPALGGSSH